MNVPYEITKDFKLLHRTPVYQLWNGDSPSPEDLLRHLKDPFQLKVMLAHTVIRPCPFGVGDAEVVYANEFSRIETSTESYAKLLGVPAEALHKSKVVVAKEVRKLRTRFKRKKGSKPKK